MTRESFPLRVKGLRVRLKIGNQKIFPQVELAGAILTPPDEDPPRDRSRTVIRWEKGQNFPSPADAQRHCDSLHRYLRDDREMSDTEARDLAWHVFGEFLERRVLTTEATQTGPPSNYFGRKRWMTEEEEESLRVFICRDPELRDVFLKKMLFARGSSFFRFPITHPDAGMASWALACGPEGASLTIARAEASNLCFLVSCLPPLYLGILMDTLRPAYPQIVDKTVGREGKRGFDAACDFLEGVSTPRLEFFQRVYDAIQGHQPVFRRFIPGDPHGPITIAS